MPLKIYYKNEIHRVTKFPATLGGLVQTVQNIFKNELPSNFILQYEDTEGDKIVLTSQEDYNLALSSELSSSSKSLKIYLTDADQSKNSSFVVTDLNNQDNLSVNQSSVNDSNRVVIEDEPVPPTENEPFEEKTLDSNENVISPNKEETTAVAQETDSGNNVTQVEKEKVEVRNTSNNDQFREIAKEVLQEEIPTIAMIVKQLLEDSDSHISHPRRENQPQPNGAQTVKAVHSRVTCDGCGAHPVIGNRWKCTVNDDYDLCDNCEARGTHAYPLIKITSEAQYPHIHKLFNRGHGGHEHRRFPRCHGRWGRRHGDLFSAFANEVNPNDLRQFTDVAHKVAEDIKASMTQSSQRSDATNAEEMKDSKSQPQPETNVPDLSKLINSFLPMFGGNNSNTGAFPNLFPSFLGNPRNNIFANFAGQTGAPSTRSETQANQNTKQKEEPIQYDATFLRELDTVPAKIRAQDPTIFKTISVKNTGSRAWPASTFIESKSGVEGQVCKLPAVEAGKEFSTVLILKSPSVTGNFSSEWKFGFTNESGAKEYFGKEFSIKFSIFGEENLIKECAVPVEEKNTTTTQEVNITEDKTDVPQKKSYHPEVIEKARGVLEVFPQIQIEEALEYISLAPQKTLEELILDYLANL